MDRRLHVKPFRLEHILSQYARHCWENYYEIFHSLSLETMNEWSELRDETQIVTSEAFMQSLLQFISLFAFEEEKYFN